MREKYCCHDMDSAIEHEFLIERDNEILFNRGKHPLEAGNIITGETYDPKKIVFTMSLSFCPFCSKRLVKK